MSYLTERDAEALFNIDVYEELSVRDQIRLREAFINNYEDLFETAYGLYYGSDVDYGEYGYRSAYYLLSNCKESLIDGDSDLNNKISRLLRLSLDAPDVFDALEHFVFTYDYADRLRHAMEGSSSRRDDYLDLVEVIAHNLGVEKDVFGNKSDISHSLLYNGYLEEYLGTYCDFGESDVENFIRDLEEYTPSVFKREHLGRAVDSLYGALDDVYDRVNR